MASIRPSRSAAATRSSGPNASGSTSRIGTMPSDTVSMSMSAPPCSHSSCRQRPHGISGWPSPPTQATATRRPPPVRARSLTMPHSAHRPRPYEAFSTLHPVTSRPSSTSPATPTGNFEYGA